jgi:glycosyltransferase involved in cell wall biosynthesis
MILLSHPTGNANIRQTLLALSEADLLAEFWTGVAWDDSARIAGLVPPSLRREMARRSFADVAGDRVRTHPWREFGRLLAAKVTLPSYFTAHETGALSVDSVFRSLDARVARRLSKVRGLTGVYSGEDGALATFTEASRLGLHRYYDLPIGCWRAGRAIFEEEREREPEWAMTLDGLRDSPSKLERKDEELRLASTVFVASTFARQTLESAPDLPGRVKLASYGAPMAAPVLESPGMPADTDRLARPLRVLFVGSLGQRKGLSYLIAALTPLGKHVTLTLIGRRGRTACVPLDRAIREHRWIPSLPNFEVRAEMGRHDVLVFPSLFEGFGLVIVEALAQGIPVITTAHTAGPDVLTDGQDGFIVPIRSSEAITRRLERLMTERGLLAAMRNAARNTAERRTWAEYRRCLQQEFLAAAKRRMTPSQLSASE